MLHRETAWRDVFHHEPVAEGVVRLDRWLRANPGTWLRLYHGTSAALPILHEGLRPTTVRRRNSLQSRSGYVSFSIYPGHAETFGRLAFPQQRVVVYAVDLRVGELVPDRDQLRNQRLWVGREVKNTLAHSLAFGHGAQVRGPVPCERLIVEKMFMPPTVVETRFAPLSLKRDAAPRIKL